MARIPMSDYDRSAGARYGAAVARPGAAVDQGLRAYMLGVYNYMTLGLGITGVVAYFAFRFGTVELASGRLGLTAFGQAIYASPLRWLVVLAPLGIIFLMSGRANSMTAASARNTFFVFAAAMGLSMSALLVVYTGGSVALAFFQAAAAFGALSLYGYTTRRDLSAMGSFMMMGLFGIIIVSLVNLFLQSSGVQWALSILAVGIFAGLTAWDTQAIKSMYYAGLGSEAREKASVFGALKLYLDFVNIFQSLLYLTGNQRNN
jgi:uncharacterized protein